MNSINKYRKKITKSLTGGISQSATKLPDNLAPKSIKRVLICRPNHRLGNQLLITPLVEEVSQRFPNASIDLFVKGGASYPIFEKNPRINRIIALPKKHFKQLGSYIGAWFRLKKRRYDLVLNITPGSSSGRLSTKAARATHKLFGDEFTNLEQYFRNYHHIAKKPVFNLRRLLQIGDAKAIPNLNLWLTKKELDQGRKILEQYCGDTPAKTIGIFTYATGQKCYTKTWWNSLYKKLKKRFPDHAIVEILPVENVSQIDFAAPAYYSKDLREIAAFIANTSVFIGADSGMMHLASASQTTTIGLFKGDFIEKYQPYHAESMGFTITDDDLDHQKQLLDHVEAKLSA